MSRPEAALGAVLALGLLACGAPPARVAVHLEARHARPAEIREVWSARFRAARDQDLLAITRAEARLEPPGLQLDALVRVDVCDAATAEATRLALVDLATGRHAFAAHRVAAARAETLAQELRARLGVDVSTPADRPGQVVIATDMTRVRPLLPADVLVAEVEARDGSTALWVLDPAPALDGRAVATARADDTGLDVTLTDDGARALQALSDAALGEHLVLFVDGRFALAPRVMTRLHRRLRLELPEHPAAISALARAIAASNLPDPPELVRSEARCAPAD